LTAAGPPPSSWDALSLDLARTFDRPLPAGVAGRLVLLAQALTTVKGIAIVGYRASHRLARRSGLAAGLVKQVTQAISGADIAPAARIGPGVRIYHPSGIVISDEATIGSHCTIQSCITIGRRTVIGDQVEIGPGARVLPDVTIDDGCHLAANAVLVRSIPGAWTVLAGVPAKPLRPRERSEAGRGRARRDAQA